MYNRFFDIDKNVHLNSFYIFILLINSGEIKNVESLMLSLYLLKYPSKIIDISNNITTKVDEKLFEEFQIDNIQSNMLKYSSSTYIEGFNEALYYLYSKNIIDYDLTSNSVIKTKIYSDVDTSEISPRIMKISEYINSIIEKYGVKKIQEYL